MQRSIAVLVGVVDACAGRQQGYDGCNTSRVRLIGTNSTCIKHTTLGVYCNSQCVVMQQTWRHAGRGFEVQVLAAHHKRRPAPPQGPVRLSKTWSQARAEQISA